MTLVPLVWILLTGFKTPPDSIAYPPKILFQPSLEGYCNLFSTRTRQTPEYINSLGPATGVCDETVAVFRITGGSGEDIVIAPWWWLALVPIATVLMVVAATSLPARLATRIPTADALRYE